MDILTNAIDGFGHALTPTNLLYCFIGVIVGTIVGILPGLGPATGISLLLPITLGLAPLPALIMLAGIYYGCMHGGIVAAVLIATPGESAAIVTVMDGHKLARAGRAGPVLAISALSSFLAGTLTIPFVMVFTSVLGNVSLKFGPPETSVIMLIGLVGVVGFVGSNRMKGFAMAAAGILISTVGLDVGTGIPRFTFGIPAMFGGIDFLYVVVGMFALAEVLHSIGAGQPNPIRTRLRDMLISKDDWVYSRFPILRGGILGLCLGMLPGAGATVSSFVSYDVERRIGKRKGRILGTGVIEGVSGPQAADNAAANGAFIPTLSLGIPGSAATAVLLGGFLLHGIPAGAAADDQPAGARVGPAGLLLHRQRDVDLREHPARAGVRLDPAHPLRLSVPGDHRDVLHRRVLGQQRHDGRVDGAGLRRHRLGCQALRLPRRADDPRRRARPVVRARRGAER